VTAPILPLAITQDQIWIVTTRGGRSIASRVAIIPDSATFLALPTGQFDTQASVPIYPQSGARMPGTRWATFADICTHRPVFGQAGGRRSA
jgi:hypothetical protein